MENSQTKELRPEIMHRLIKELWLHSNHCQDQIRHMGLIVSEVSKSTEQFRQIIYSHLQFLIDNGFLEFISNDPLLYQFTEKGKTIKTENDILEIMRYSVKNSDIKDLDISNTADFIALLKYKTTKEGGRLTPAHSGYRPQVKFPFTRMSTSGIQTFIKQDTVAPGGSVMATIKIIQTEYFKGKLYENLAFDICEGTKIIGSGEITSIVNLDLKAH